MLSLTRPFKLFGDNHFSMDNKQGPQNEYLRTLFGQQVKLLQIVFNNLSKDRCT